MEKNQGRRAYLIKVMNGGHKSDQLIPQVCFVRKPAGKDNKTGNKLDTGQNLSQPGQKLVLLSQKLQESGQNLTQPGQKLALLSQKLQESGQNLSQPGQKLSLLSQKLQESGQNLSQPGQKLALLSQKLQESGQNLSQPGQKLVLLSQKFQESGQNLSQPGQKLVLLSQKLQESGQNLSQPGQKLVLLSQKFQESGQNLSQPGQKVVLLSQKLQESGQNLSQPGQKLVLLSQKLQESGQNLSQPGHKLVLLSQKLQESGQNLSQPGQKLALLSQKLHDSGQNLSQPGQKLSLLSQKLQESGQNLSQPGQKLALLSQKLQESGQNLSQPGQKLALLSQKLQESGQNLSQPGQKLVLLSQKFQESGQNLSQPGQKLALLSQKLQESGQNLSQPGQKLALLSQKLQESGQNLSQPGQKLALLSQKFQESGQNLSQPGQKLVLLSQKLQESGQNLSQPGQKLALLSQKLHDTGQNLSQPGQKLALLSQKLQESGQNLSQQKPNLIQIKRNLQQSGQKLPQSSEKLPQAGQNLPQSGQSLPQYTQQSQLSGQNSGQNISCLRSNISTPPSFLGPKDDPLGYIITMKDGEKMAEFVMRSHIVTIGSARSNDIIAENAAYHEVLLQADQSGKVLIHQYDMRFNTGRYLGQNDNFTVGNKSFQWKYTKDNVVCVMKTQKFKCSTCNKKYITKVRLCHHLQLHPSHHSVDIDKDEDIVQYNPIQVKVTKKTTNAVTPNLVPVRLPINHEPCMTRQSPTPNQGLYPVKLSRAFPVGRIRSPGVRHQPYPMTRLSKPTLNLDKLPGLSNLDQSPIPSILDRLPVSGSRIRNETDSMEIKVEVETDDVVEQSKTDSLHVVIKTELDDNDCEKSNQSVNDSLQTGSNVHGNRASLILSTEPSTFSENQQLQLCESVNVKSESSSIIPNKPSDLKYSDNVFLGGLSLDSDLSNSLSTTVSDWTVQLSANSQDSSGDSQTSLELDPNVIVKHEVTAETEMDIDTTGVKLGQTSSIKDLMLNVPNEMQGASSSVSDMTIQQSYREASQDSSNMKTNKRHAEKSIEFDNMSKKVRGQTYSLSCETYDDVMMDNSQEGEEILSTGLEYIPSESVVSMVDGSDCSDIISYWTSKRVSSLANVSTGDLRDKNNEIQSSKAFNAGSVTEMDEFKVSEDQMERDINNPKIFVRKLHSLYVHVCKFCGKVVKNILMHLKGHDAEPLVKDIVKLEKERGAQHPVVKAKWELLKFHGNHIHNLKVIKDGQGEIILGKPRAGEFDITNYAPCPRCFIWLKIHTAKYVNGHLPVCPANLDKISKRESLSLRLQLVSQVNDETIDSNTSLVNEVLTTMTNDEIGQIAAKDNLIVEMGNIWMSKAKGNELKRKYYTFSRMRDLARMLVNLREETGLSQHHMTDFLIPEHFNNVAASALKIASLSFYDLEDLKSPSTAIKICDDLKRLGEAKLNIAIKDDNLEEIQNVVKATYFLKLVDKKLASTVTKLSDMTLLTWALNKKHLLTQPEDIVKITSEVKQEIEAIVEELRNETTQTSFERGVMLAETRLLMFNKIRAGEIDGIRIKEFARHTTSIKHHKSYVRSDLSEIEQTLIEGQEVLETRGKYGTGVLVIIPKDTVALLTLLSISSVREDAGIRDNNPYLFADNNMGVTRSFESYKSLCSELDLPQPEQLTTVKLRKCTAIISQVFDLSSEKQTLVMNHLKQATEVLKFYYKQTSDTVESLDIVKLVLLQEFNLASKYSSKKLSEIRFKDLCTDVDGRVELPENNLKRQESGLDLESSELSDNDQESQEYENCHGKVDVGIDLKGEILGAKFVSKVKWTEKEVEEIGIYFKENLSTGSGPRVVQCKNAIKLSKENGGTLHRRTWTNIKKKVFNLIKKNNSVQQ